MWNDQKVSVVMPAYNEEQGIGPAVQGFLETGIPDEVVVVNNNSKDRTAEFAEDAGARVVMEKRQGYGAALQRGLKEAQYDLIVMVEPDGSFRAHDVNKLLHYSDQFPVVFGTRTAKSMLGDGAKMNLFNRWGNITVAKLLTILHNGPSLTDVGCTFKIIHKKAYKKIKHKLKVTDSRFSPHFMITCLRSGLNAVEVPVNYLERVGDSKITSNFFKTLKLGMRMIFMIIGDRFKKI